MRIRELPETVYASLATIELGEFHVTKAAPLTIDRSTIDPDDYEIPSHRGKHAGVYKGEVEGHIVVHEAARYGFGVFRHDSNVVVCIRPDAEQVQTWADNVAVKLDKLETAITEDDQRLIESLEWA